MRTPILVRLNNRPPSSILPNRVARWLRALPVLALLLLLGQSGAWAQTVNQYGFTPSTGATLQDMSTGTTQLVAASSDDGASPLTSIGFTFTYNGSTYTQFGASANGYIRMGAVVASAGGSADYSNSLASANQAPVIAPYWDDLATGSDGKVHYKLIGTSPSQTLVVEWRATVPRNVGGVTTGVFQLQLNQADNSIDFVYGALAANSGGASIGLSTSSSNYNSVTASTNTASTTTVNNANTAAIPAGTKYRFTPPVAQTYTSSTVVQGPISTVAQGATNQQVVQLQVVTAGTLTPLSVTSITASTAGTPGTTSLSDVSNVRIYYTGTNSSFSTTTQFGTAQAPGTTMTFTGTQALAAGTNYFFLVYDVAAGATPGNVIDAAISSVTVASVARTPTVTDPAGSRTIVGPLAGGTDYTIDNTAATGGTSTLIAGAGSGRNFANFTAAINALNGGITGPVTFNVASGQTFVEPGVVPTITTTGTAANPISFVKATTTSGAANPKVQVAGTASTNDAALSMAGDYISFNSIDVAASGSALEFGYAIYRTSATDGSQNISITNSTITLDKTNANSVGIYSPGTSSGGVAIAPTSAAGANSNLTINSNTVTNVATGIFLGGGAAAFPDLNVTVGGAGAASATTGNTVTNFAATGIFVNIQGAAQVNNNTVNNTAGGGSAAAGVLVGIAVGGATASDATISYNTVTLTQGSSSTMNGIQSTTAGAVANTTLMNQNTVNMTVLNTTASALAGQTVGIFNQGATGIITMTNNTVSFTVTLNGTGGFSGTATYGVYNGSASSNTGLTSTSISNNTFSFTKGGTGTGLSTTTLAAIYNVGTGLGTTNVSNNTWGSASVTTTIANVGATYFIYNSNGTSNILAANNQWRKLTFTGTSSSSVYGYYNLGGPGTGTQTLTGNVIDNIDVSNGGTSSGLFGGLYSYTSTSQTQVMNGNTVTNITNGTGTIYGVYNNAASATSTYNTNTINNFYSYAGTGVQAGVYVTTGGAQIQGNNITGFTSNGTGSMYGIYTTGATGATINSNTINSLVSDNAATTSSSTVAGIYSTAVLASVYGNTVTSITGQGVNGSSNNTSAPVVYGIYATVGTSTVQATGNVYGNTINTVASTGTGTAYGLYVVGGSTSTGVTGHSIYDVSSGSGTAYGIYVASAASNTLSVFKNKVYGIGLTGGTGATTPTNLVYGLFVSGNSASTSVVTASNNLIGLNGRISSQPSLSASGNNVLNGIGVGGTSAATVNLYFNTVSLEGTGGTNFGGSALNITTATPVVNSRNNIFSNTVSATGTGIVVTYRRPAAPTTTNSPVATTNNNLYYAGTPGTANLIYTDGTNSYQTLAAYQGAAATAGRDANSVSEFVNFITTSGSSANFLHINTATDTQVESAGVNISGITTDYDNVVRAGNTGYAGTGTAPDLGADEGEFVPKDLTAPSISYTVLNNTGSTTNRTLVATITDASGVATGTNAPRIYYRKGTTGAYFSAVATSVSGSSYTFTINYANVTGGSVTGNDVIQYYVAAQDNASTPNIGSNPSGATGINPPGSTGFTGTPNAYTILPSLAGIYYIGTGTSPNPARTYATITAALTNAASATPSGYNNSGLAGAVTFYLLDNSYSTGETFPLVINSNSDASATNTLTIKPYTGALPVLTGSTTGPLVQLNGAAYVVLDGSNTASGTTRDWTLTNTNTGTSSGLVALSSNAGGTSPANNVVKNLTLTGNATTTTLYGVGMAISAPATTGASNNTITNNAISKVQVGISVAGLSNTVRDANTTISNNLIGATGTGNGFGGSSAFGITASNQNLLSVTGNTIRNANVSTATVSGIELASNVSNATVSGNTIRDIVTSGSSQYGSFTNTPLTGIRLNTNTTGAVIDANTIFNIKTTATGGYGAYGILVSTAALTANNRLSNNVITDVNGASNYSGFTNSSSAGIYISSQSSAQSGISVLFNTVNMFGSSTYSSAVSTAALAVENNSSGLTVVNNILANGMTGSSGGSPYSLFSNAPAASFTLINKNDYYSYGAQAPASGVQVSINGTAYTTLATVQTATGQDAGSVSVDPGFTQAATAPYNLTPSALQLNNTAATGTGVTTDNTGATRGTSPDIGALEFTPVLVDVRPTVLVNPTTIGCFTNTQAVTVRLNNNGVANQDFTANPTTVTVVVTFPNATTQTLTTTVNSNAGNPGGTSLATGGNRDVTLPGTINMSAGGNYSFAITTVTTGDQNTANDNLTVTRTVGPQATLPQTVDFNAYTGTDANLNTTNPGWREATGTTTPTIAESSWTNRTFANSGGSNTTTAAVFNFYTANAAGWILSPRLVPVTATTVLTYDVALTAYFDTAPGSFDSDDLFEVRISTDCGATFSALRTYNSTTTPVISASGQTETISLSSYAGQQVMIGFFITEGPTATGDMDIFVDNIDVRTPTTIDLTATALVAPAATSSCYSTAEPVTVTIKNASNSASLNFATNNATVTVAVTPPTGPVQNFTGTLNTGTLAANATQNVTLPGTLNMSAIGTYTFAISATVSGDQNTANDALATSPTRTVVAPTAGAVSPASNTICFNTSTSFTVAGTANGTIQWQVSTTSATTGFTDIAGANGTSYTTPALTPNTYYYRVQVRCDTRSATSTNVATVMVTNPTLASGPTTNPASGTVCEGNTVTISATKQASQTGVRFFTAASGGTPLTGVTNSGNVYSYTTPVLTAGNPTYYVAAYTGSQEMAGLATPIGTTGSFVSTGYGLLFNTTGAITIASTTIYPTGSGNITFALYDNTGAELSATSPIAVTGSGLTTPVTVTLNLAVPTAGTGYRLLVKAYDAGITGLVRDNPLSGGAAFPFNSPSGAVSFTGGWLSGSSSTSAYYFFYNIVLGTQCEGTRTAVPLTVTSPPPFTVTRSTTQPVCAGTSVNVTGMYSPSNYDTFVYSASPSGASAGINQTPGTPNATLTPTVTTTYTVTASLSTAGAGGCQAVRTFTITVNPLPTVTAYASPTNTNAGDPATIYAAAGDLTTDYTVQQVPYNAFTVPGTGVTTYNSSSTPASGSLDQGYFTATLPFAFNFFNVNQAANSTLYIGTNGYISFGAGYTSDNTSNIPSTTTPNNFIAGDGRDLQLANGGTMNVFTIGTAPNRIMVIDYTDVAPFSSTNPLSNFQIALYEGSNVIDIISKNLPSANHTQGIENAAGTVGYASIPASASTTTAWALVGTTYRYSPGTTAGYTFTTNPGNLTGSSVTVNPTTTTTYSVTATNTTTGCTSPATNVTVNVVPSLVINGGNSPYSIPAGTYYNITVQSGGTATFAGAASLTGNVVVQNGATLNTGCQAITGPGTFTVQSGGTLGVCNANGLTLTGTTSDIQMTGTRSFSNDASYVYNGTGAQVTGAGLPAIVRNLTVNNGNALTLSQAVAVRQVARLQSGNLTTSATNTLTLRSETNYGTALVDNTGGTVSGSTNVMQRAVDITTNDNIGYHHYSSPVVSTPINDLQTPGFDFVLNPTFNTATLTGQTRPYPTVLGYDQARIATSPATDLGAFDKGFFSPTSGDLMAVGRGYTANVPNALNIDFVGAFNNGPVAAGGTLTRDANVTGQEGWQLLGNPYPSPLNWATVTAAQRVNLDAAAYVYHATSRYTGFYTTYLTNGLVTNGVNNVGTATTQTDPIIDAGAGFFARVTAAGTGALNLTNANRVTTWGNQANFGRSSSTRTQLTLHVNTAAGATDGLVVYFDPTTTSGVDAELDATKLTNSTGLNLAALAGSTKLAIDGLPAPTVTTVVPLSLGVPAAGTYTLNVAQLANFGTTRVYLRDAVAGTEQLLSAGTQAAVTLTNVATATTRFSLVFRPSGALATAAALTAGQVSLYPNPAHSQFTLLLPPVAGAKAVQATLLNALGQTVSTRTIGLTAGGAEETFNTTGLAQGVYMLRLQAGHETLTQKVVVE